MLNSRNIRLEKIPPPVVEIPPSRPEVPDSLYADRLGRLRAEMKRAKLDWFFVYADREHSANFSWLFRIDPRFEEGAALIGLSGKPVLLLGNENLSMADLVPVEAEREHFPSFSLVGQPRDRKASLTELLRKHGVRDGQNVGTAGWKYFEPVDGELEGAFELPHYLVCALGKCVGDSRVFNRTDIFMNPGNGLRTFVEPEQIVVYEYSAALTASALFNVMNTVVPGVSELELAEKYVDRGLPNVCHPMVSFGAKAAYGLSSPSGAPARRGDFATFAFGVEGSLSSRAAYIAEGPGDLPADRADWCEKIAMRYFFAAWTWLSLLRIGAKGGEIYDAAEAVFPKARFGWSLNPGHFIATDEWTSTPFMPGSSIELKNGGYIQLDLIPAPEKPYGGANIEDGYYLADEATRKMLSGRWPDFWRRVLRRRAFMEGLGFRLADEVLPLSDIGGYYRPWLLDRESALISFER